MIIRFAVESDAPAMGQLIVETYLAAHRDHLSTEAWEKASKEWTPEVSAQNWARALHDIAAAPETEECVFIAVQDNGEIMGIVMGGSAGEDDSRLGAIYALYVSTGHQRQGIGRCLLQKAGAELARKGMTTLQIGCLSANTSARTFYESMGGRIVGERMIDEHGDLISQAIYGWTEMPLDRTMRNP